MNGLNYLDFLAGCGCSEDGLRPHPNSFGGSVDCRAYRETLPLVKQDAIQQKGLARAVDSGYTEYAKWARQRSENVLSLRVELKALRLVVV